jgi:hypothetical protein
MATIRNNPDDYAGWLKNPAAKLHADNFQAEYMVANSSDEIDSVDTWVIAGTGINALRGVVRYDKQIVNYGTTPQSHFFGNTLTHDVAFGDGDGTVLRWSAIRPNVTAENLHVRYAANKSHVELIRDENVGNYVADLVRGRDVENNPDYWGVINSEVTGESEPEWWIKWDTDVGRVWTGEKALVEQEIQNCPVALEVLEVVNSNTLKLLVGLVGFPGVPDVNGEIGPKSYVLMAHDPRFKVFEIGKDIFVSSNTQEPLSLRVVIRPSAEILDPGDVSVPTKAYEPVDIQGQLRLHHNGVDVMWPGPSLIDDGQERIVFSNLGTLGFGAYLDFNISQGTVGGSPDEMLLYVDEDGDGSSNYEVSGVIPFDNQEEIPEVSRMEVWPNPFNAGTTIKWNGVGQPVKSLEVFDVTGRLLRRAELRGLESGQFYFDGRSQEGALLPSGVYFATLRGKSGEVLETKKIGLVK